jgi:hypothetical protein
LKHVLVIDDKLFRQVEAAAVVKNVPVETMTEDLLRGGLAKNNPSPARCNELGCIFPALAGGNLCRKHFGGYTAKRPAAKWAPEVETREHDAYTQDRRKP